MEGDARRISYQALGRGVLGRASGGEKIGTVEHVLQVPELDIFDGIVLTTSGVSASPMPNQVADITDRYVVPAEEAERLGRPQAPAAFHADPSEHAGGSLHDWFGRMFGRARWKRDD